MRENERTNTMNAVVKPDMKAAVWAAIGFLVVPKAMKFVKR
jgi:hypothetical protein